MATKPMGLKSPFCAIEWEYRRKGVQTGIGLSKFFRNYFLSWRRPALPAVNVQEIARNEPESGIQKACFIKHFHQEENAP
jgi:hypothetical protein